MPAPHPRSDSVPRPRRAPPPRPRRPALRVEEMEARLTPSALVYTDVDGDRVTVTATAGSLSATFAGGKMEDGLLTFRGQGGDISVTVARAAGGDGLANIGRIDATGLALGRVTVPGDLGAIDSGPIRLLSVRSLGRYGLATQGGKGDLVSNIGGQLDSLRVAGDITGAYVRVGAGASLLKAFVGGSLVGGAGADMGEIYAEGNVGAVVVRGDVIGGSGKYSGVIDAGRALGPVAVGGSLLGGAGDSSGTIFSGYQVAGADLGRVTIGGDVRGGGGDSSGAITSTGKLAGVAVGGSVLGGAGVSSGDIYSLFDLGAVTVGRDLVGGGGEGSGRIRSSGKLTSVTVGGSVLGGAGDSSGLILIQGDLGAVRIGRDLIGGSVAGTASLDASGYIRGKRIASVFIGGSVIAGTDDSTGNQAGGDLTNSGTIRAVNDIGPVVVKGSLIGNVAPNGTTRVVISAAGQAAPTATADVAIQSLTVGGRVEWAWVLGGVGLDSVATNGNAQVGPVRVGGDWVASSLASGVTSNNGLFGDADDAVWAGGTLSRIAGVWIGGVVIGSGTGGDHFGFVARQVGSFQAGGFTAPLKAGVDVIELSPNTGDVTIREV